MIQWDESEKLKTLGKQNSEEITLKEKIKIEQNPKCTYNFSPTKTPIHLLSGQPFRFDKYYIYGKIVESAFLSYYLF